MLTDINDYAYLENTNKWKTPIAIAIGVSPPSNHPCWQHIAIRPNILFLYEYPVLAGELTLCILFPKLLCIMPTPNQL